MREWRNTGSSSETGEGEEDKEGVDEGKERRDCEVEEDEAGIEAEEEG